ncbi:hypothetical protein [Sinomicrobium sp.]
MMKSFRKSGSIPAVLFSLGLVALLNSCSSDDDNAPIEEGNASSIIPEITVSTVSSSEEEAIFRIGESVTLTAKNLNEAVYEEEWTLNEEVVSTEDEFVFEPEAIGVYSLKYRAFNDAGEYKEEFQFEIAIRIRPIVEDSNSYVTELFDYLPAPGQFINTSLGNMEGAKGIVGKTGTVSLGAWGGSVVLGFDHTVLNKEGEPDLLFENNAMSNFSEPGIVYVMADENGNGLPDDTWYEIKGSAHDMEGVDRNYEVTYYRPEDPTQNVPWTDNRGNSGEVLVNSFHKQPYYPEWIEEDNYTLRGTLLPDVNIDRSNPSYITSNPLDYGYADNIQGGDQIDISDAIDANGEAVSLEGIDFVKVQTGIQADMGWLGELSTEVLGISDLNLQ